MTPENWPEPVALRYKPSLIFPDFVLKLYCTATLQRVNEAFPERPADPLYTATQVREIVRMEVEQLKLDADEMVRQMLDAMTSSKTVRVSNDYLAAMRDARKWLKENKE